METTTQLTDFLKIQSIQIAAVFGIVLILHWLLRHRSAHIRYLLWLLVAIKCVTPPLVIFSVPVLPTQPQPQPQVAAVAPQPSPAPTVEPQTAAPANPQPQSSIDIRPSFIDNTQYTISNTQFPKSSITLTHLILAIYAAGGACYFLWAIAKSIHLHRRLSALRRPLPAPMAAQIADLARLWFPGRTSSAHAAEPCPVAESSRRVGSAHAVPVDSPFTVWLTESISQPFVWGLLRGAIYLPARLQSIETDRQKAVVMHEMAHVVRFDAFVNLLQILIQGIFWFHPLVWLANRFIRAEREKCCDEIAVARLGAAPKEYGSAIVDTLLQEYRAALPIPTLAVAGPVKNIEDRIKTIMRPNKRFYTRPTAIATLAILTLAALIVPTTVALTHKQQVVKESEIINSYPKAVDIIEKVQRTYADLETYSSTCEVFADYGNTLIFDTENFPDLSPDEIKLLEQNINFKNIYNTNYATKTSLTMKLARPNLYCMEWIITYIKGRGPNYTGDQLGAVWSDGKDCYGVQYNKRKRYDHFYLGGGPWGSSETVPTIFYDKHNNTLNDLKELVKEEDDVFEGQPCYVVSGLKYDKPVKYWISKERSLILKKQSEINFVSETYVRENYGLKKVLDVMGKEVTPEAIKLMDERIDNGFAKRGIVKGVVIEIQRDIAINEPVSNEQLTPSLTSNDDNDDVAAQTNPQVDQTENESQNSNFTASLPNGVTVELVGLCEHPSEGKPWWKPDGSELKDRPYQQLKSKNNDVGVKLYEIVYRVRGSGEILTGIDTDSKWIKSSYAPKLLTKAADGIQLSNAEDCYEVIIGCDPNIEQTDIAILIGSGLLWNTDTSMEAMEGATLANTSTNGPSAIIAAPIEKDRRVYVNMAIKTKGLQFRAIAIDKSGKMHSGSWSSTIQQNMGMLEAEFDLPLSEIKAIQFQTQKFQPVTFKNISLRPGQKTDVKIETQRSVAAAKSEGVAAGPNETGVSAIQKIKLSGDDVVQVEANAGQGFNFPFYLFIPKGIDTHQPVYVLVETNNTGTATDDFEFHRQKAQQLVKESYANRMARSLEVPLLVPVFPRPKENWQVYTHALDRDSLEIKEGQLQRIDLQLAAMIKYARDLLHTNGIKTQDRVFMDGFSASAKFCNHFAFLHPEMVKAVASGGVNGIPTLPVSRWNGYDLPFPIGIADLKDFTGQPFNEKAYRLVSQYIYMGYLDRNDTVPSRDAWSEEEATLIKKAVAEKMMPDRWEVTQKIYREQQIPAQLVTYNGVGHTIKDEMLDDVVKFFRANSGDTFVPIEPHVYPFVEYGEIHEAHVNGVYWQGDKSLPEFVRKDQSGDFNVLIGIEEWFKGQDHRQLDEFVQNAGFKFVLKADGQKDILIDKNNYHGNCSMGDGKFQAFYVNLDEDLLMTMVTGVPYTLQPLNSSDKYVWTVNNGVTLLKPKNEEATVNSAAQKEFKTTLSDGVMVELLGICEHPSEGKQWWQPDGSVLKNSPYEKMPTSHTNPQSGRKALEAAVKINGAKDGIGFRHEIVGTQSSGSCSTGDQTIYAVSFDQPESADQTDVRIGIAAGPWQTVAAQQGDFSGVYSTNAIIWHSPAEKNGKTILNIAHSLVDQNIRVVAVGRNGKEHTGGSTSSQKKGLESVQYNFDLPLSKTKEFQFQTRPYEWITFKNVSLKPGHKTDVKVEMQKSETGIDFVPANFDLQLDSNRRTCHLVVSIPNRGKTVLPKMNLQFYRGDPNQNLDEVGNTHHGWHSAGPIEPGETWNERTADFHLTDGQYEFNAILDYDNTVVETDETNNTISLQIKIVNDQIAEKNVSLRPGMKTNVNIEPQNSDSGVQLPIENQKSDCHLIGLGSGWSWIQRAVGKHYRGSIGGYSDDQAKCSEYFEEVLSWSKPGDTFFLTFAFDEEQYGHTQLVPEKYRDLLPMSWDDLKKQIEQGKTVEAQGQARGLNTMVLAAPTLDQLVELIKTTKLLDPFRNPNAPAPTHSERSEKSDKLTSPQTSASIQESKEIERPTSWKEAVEAKAKAEKRLFDPNSVDPNSQFSTLNSPFVASLPNGVTVELLGIADVPVKGGQWWAADGSPVQNVLWDGTTKRHGDDQDLKQVIFRISGYETSLSPDVAPMFGFSICNVSPELERWTEYFPVKKGEENLCELFGSLFKVDPTLETVDISYTIGQGPWETLATKKAYWKSDESIPEKTKLGTVIINKPTETWGKSAISATLLSRPSGDWNFIAVDKQGQVHLPKDLRHYSEGESPEHMIFKAEFDVPLKKVDEFRFQTRATETVTFKNVSLKPGQKTDVKIETPPQSN